MLSKRATPTPQPTPREIRIAIVFTAAVLLTVVFLKAANPDVRGSSFMAMYAAGRIVRVGHGSRLYDLAEQTRAEDAISKRPSLVAIVHPPFEALFFAPLAKLSYTKAYLVWGVINIVLWMLFAYLARSFAPVPRQTLRYMLLCFAFFPLWVILFDGQTTLVLLNLYFLVYLSLKRQNDFRAGAFLGLGLFKFQLVLPFALICLLRGKWRMMAGFAAAALLLGALSIVAVGPSGVISYVTFLESIVRHPADPAHYAILPSYMASVRGILSALLAGHVAPAWIHVAIGLVSGLLIIFTAEVWRRRERHEADSSPGMAFAAALAVTLMTAFHLYPYDLSLLLLATLLTIGSPECSRRKPWRTLLYVSIGIFYLQPLYLLLGHWNRLYLFFLPLCGFALAIFAMPWGPPHPELATNRPSLSVIANPSGELKDGEPQV